MTDSNFVPLNMSPLSHQALITPNNYINNGWLLCWTFAILQASQRGVAEKEDDTGLFLVVAGGGASLTCDLAADA